MNLRFADGYEFDDVGAYQRLMRAHFCCGSQAFRMKEFAILIKRQSAKTD